jgi:ABC-type branched-subunit amino acid transport system substrate-binding protein
LFSPLGHWLALCRSSHRQQVRVHPDRRPGGALKLKELSLPYFFQVLNFSETQGPALAGIFKEVGVKSVAVIYRGDLHGIEYGNAMVPDFKKRGIEVKLNKSYPPEIKDLSPF